MSPTAAAARTCSVPDCARPIRARGLCRRCGDRARRGLPPSATVDPRQAVKAARHQGRSHRQALADLVGKLQTVGICETPEEAIRVVAVFVEHWPGPTVDLGFDHVPASDLAGVGSFSASGRHPGSVWP